jgi:hypothetical protein
VLLGRDPDQPRRQDRRVQGERALGPGASVRCNPHFLSRTRRDRAVADPISQTRIRLAHAHAHAHDPTHGSLTHPSSQDSILFSITPPDTLRGPIGDARLVVPVRLVTDPYTPGAQSAYPRVSPPGSDDALDDAVSLAYDAEQRAPPP